MTKRGLKKEAARAWKMAPGFIVVNCSTRQGGIHYERTPISEHKINAGMGLEAEHKTRKIIDHLDAVALVDALVKKADYACRANGTNTVLGWYYDEINLRKLRIAIAGLEEEAVQVNAVAAHAGSEARAYISVAALQVDAASKECAREIARTIRDVLGDVLAALRAGQVKRGQAPGSVLEDRLHAPLLRCRNLDRLAVGLAGESVKMALRCIPAAKKEILEQLKQGGDPTAIGAALNLAPIENALAWFEEDGFTGGEDDTSAAVDEALQAGG